MKDKVKFQGLGRQIIEKLRVSGYAFDSIKSVMDRKFKIAKMLNNDAVLGTSISPDLKDGIILRLEFCVNSIKLYVNDGEVIGDKPILIIEDAYDCTVNDVVFKIGKIYTDYTYSNKELRELIEGFEDAFKLNEKRVNKLKMLLGKLNKTLPLRYFYSYKDTIKFYFGASLFTIEVTYSVEKNELHTFLFLYKKNGRKYSEVYYYWGIEYSKPKYAPYLKNIVDYKYLTVHTVADFINAFEMIKKTEKGLV
jgi:hypothetical protein